MMMQLEGSGFENVLFWHPRARFLYVDVRTGTTLDLLGYTCKHALCGFVTQLGRRQDDATMWVYQNGVSMQSRLQINK